MDSEIPLPHYGKSDLILACVRKRPLSQTDIENGNTDIVTVSRADAIVVDGIRKDSAGMCQEKYVFHFDHIFDSNVGNGSVYEYAAKPLINTIIEGGMATCFIYGQSGSGKTYTMAGEPVDNGVDGMHVHATRDVFRKLSDFRLERRLRASISYYEMYNNKMYDLLAGKRIIRFTESNQHAINIASLSENAVASCSEALKLVQTGNKIRCGKTMKDKLFSSHAIYEIILREYDSEMLHGKLSFIDVVGYDCAADGRGRNRKKVSEKIAVNKTLLALKECIRAIGSEAGQVPCHQTLLTKVLRDSFIGKNCKTCIIGTISPCSGSAEYTLTTLKFTSSIKRIHGMKPSKIIMPKQLRDTMGVQQATNNCTRPHNDSVEKITKQQLKVTKAKSTDTVIGVKCRPRGRSETIRPNLKASQTIIKGRDKKLKTQEDIKIQHLNLNENLKKFTLQSTYLCSKLIKTEAYRSYLRDSKAMFKVLEKNVQTLLDALDNADLSA